MSSRKKLFLIYLLVLILGFIAGWFIVSYDNYLKWQDSASRPDFWEFFKP